MTAGEMAIILPRCSRRVGIGLWEGLGGPIFGGERPMEGVVPDQAMVPRTDEDENHRLWREMQARLATRLNLPDTSTPEFQAEARRQAALIRGTPEDIEALDFIEAVMIADGWGAVDGKE